MAYPDLITQMDLYFSKNQRANITIKLKKKLQFRNIQ